MMEEMTKKETDPIRKSMLVHKGQFFTEMAYKYLRVAEVMLY